jgi:ech hydrogenase subunit D
MSQEQIEIIPLEALMAQAKAKQTQGCRLVQISATKLPTEVELTYSFDLNRTLSNFRLSLPDGTHLPSISGVFGCAVLYENEIHDLFGVPVDGLSIDFKGNFYKTSVKYPFGSTKAPAAPAAPAKVPVAAATPVEAKQ